MAPAYYARPWERVSEADPRAQLLAQDRSLLRILQPAFRPPGHAPLRYAMGRAGFFSAPCSGKSSVEYFFGRPRSGRPFLSGPCCAAAACLREPFVEANSIWSVFGERRGVNKHWARVALSVRAALRCCAGRTSGRAHSLSDACWSLPDAPGHVRPPAVAAANPGC